MPPPCPVPGDSGGGVVVSAGRSSSARTSHSPSTSKTHDNITLSRHARTAAASSLCATSAPPVPPDTAAAASLLARSSAPMPSLNARSTTPAGRGVTTSAVSVSCASSILATTWRQNCQTHPHPRSSRPRRSPSPGLQPLGVPRHPPPRTPRRKAPARAPRFCAPAPPPRAPMRAPGRGGSASSPARPAAPRHRRRRRRRHGPWLLGRPGCCPGCRAASVIVALSHDSRAWWV
ncbi:hypothetical protein VFPFJ_00267 [Purpureocillium lilacinum]|uniref:Uncharacterized protein n=1 Tax=Purpureocillium lilacinum TaxID=33203 RepID=A0A179HXE6_PURLI|nr:hypothetical protein VFPFJ_00267 [Purpureocillium lilacinum]OAQ94158.1 hypothetical protein VFPFJ_00267 [Purpureocillium lilacinum]